MSSPVELPSPVEPAKVDAWVKRRLFEKGAQNRSALERALPSELAGGNAYKAIEASLTRLRNSGEVQLANGRFLLRSGVKP